jgi:hypothetical protein
MFWHGIPCSCCKSVPEVSVHVKPAPIQLYCILILGKKTSINFLYSYNFSELRILFCVLFQFFVKDNQGDEELTVINYLCIIGSTVDATNMQDFKRVS